MDIFLFVQSAQIFFLVISLSFPTHTKTAAQKAAVLYYKIYFTFYIVRSVC